MTNDEVKIKIEELACYARTKGWDDEYTEAVNMAVKALEQQPTYAVDRVTIREYLYSLGMGIKVTTTDCISRESVNDLVRELGNILNGTESRRDVSTVLTDILYLPSVTPQQKMGRWKRINKEKYVQHAMSYYRCSECGEEIIGKHNYCPMCGCKMQEVKNEISD